MNTKYFVTLQNWIKLKNLIKKRLLKDLQQIQENHLISFL